jgi:hypothetical protein
MERECETIVNRAVCCITTKYFEGNRDGMLSTLPFVLRRWNFVMLSNDVSVRKLSTTKDVQYLKIVRHNLKVRIVVIFITLNTKVIQKL